MKLFRRIRLFARDYCSEFGVAWSLARMRDCERNGGHYWGDASYDPTMCSRGRECSRCGTWKQVTSSPSTLPVANVTGQQGWCL